MRPPLAIIGFGNMGTALAQGAIRAGLITSGRFAVADVDPAKRELALRLGAQTFASVGEIAEWIRSHREPGPQLVLAIKPQSLSSATNVIREAGGLGSVTVTSVLAGVTISRLQRALGGLPRVIRAMPNLAAGIGESTSAWSPSEGMSGSDCEFAIHLLRSIGPVVMQVPEDLLDGFTALAGSGPAYLYYLAESMVQAGVNIGFTHDQAHAIVRQTLKGAALLMDDSARTPDQLRQAVTSRGGTTAAATTLLDAKGAPGILMEAILAARDRSRTLASGE